MLRQLEQITRVMATMPVFAKPVGFSARAQTDLGVRTDPQWREDRVLPIEGGAVISTYPHYERDGTLRVVRAPLIDSDYSGFGVDITVNSLGCVLEGDPMFKDAQGGMWMMPRQDSSEEGLPRFTRCIVVTSHKEPLYVRVSRERIHKAVSKELREAMAQAGHDVDTLPLVEPNKRFFDTARPELVQLITVHRGMANDEAVARTLLTQLPWKALLALTK
jgi:hypothetical protein